MSPELQTIRQALAARPGEVFVSPTMKELYALAADGTVLIILGDYDTMTDAQIQEHIFKMLSKV